MRVAVYSRLEFILNTSPPIRKILDACWLKYKADTFVNDVGGLGWADFPNISSFACQDINNVNCRNGMFNKRRGLSGSSTRTSLIFPLRKRGKFSVQPWKRFGFLFLNIPMLLRESEIQLLFTGIRSTSYWYQSLSQVTASNPLAVLSYSASFSVIKTWDTQPMWPWHQWPTNPFQIKKRLQNTKNSSFARR